MGWLLRLFQRKRRASGVSWELTPAQPFAVMIGGRRYVSVPYPLAKDAPEVKRLDMQHHLLYMLRKKHFEAPLDAQHVKRNL